MLHIQPVAHAVAINNESAIHQEVLAEAAFSTLEYGKEFDDAAKGRMISGCRMLAPWLDETLSVAGRTCIEFGPFRNPLLEPKRMPGASITYVDGDAQVIAELREMHRSNPSIKTFCADLNSPIPLSVRLLASEHQGPAVPLKFDVLVASQIINYIDYGKFLEEITKLASRDAFLFLNNVIDYGIPELFSKHRPKSDCEVIATLKRLGWTIERQVSVPSQFVQKEQPRLLVMAKKFIPWSV